MENDEWKRKLELWKSKLGEFGTKARRQLRSHSYSVTSYHIVLFRNTRCCCRLDGNGSLGLADRPRPLDKCCSPHPTSRRPSRSSPRALQSHHFHLSCHASRWSHRARGRIFGYPNRAQLSAPNGLSKLLTGPLHRPNFLTNR